MAYSRWGRSIWYTFWAAGDSVQKQDQCFEICDFPSYRITYGELKDKGIKEVLEGVKAFYEQEHEGRIIDGLDNHRPTYKDTIFRAKNPTARDLQELSKYIKEWEKDVDKHFEETIK